MSADTKHTATPQIETFVVQAKRAIEQRLTMTVNAESEEAAKRYAAETADKLQGWINGDVIDIDAIQRKADAHDDLVKALQRIRQHADQPGNRMRYIEFAAEVDLIAAEALAKVGEAA